MPGKFRMRPVTGHLDAGDTGGGRQTQLLTPPEIETKAPLPGESPRIPDSRVNPSHAGYAASRLERSSSCGGFQTHATAERTRLGEGQAKQRTLPQRLLARGQGTLGTSGIEGKEKGEARRVHREPEHPALLAPCGKLGIHVEAAGQHHDRGCLPAIGAANRNQKKGAAHHLRSTPERADIRQRLGATGRALERQRLD